MGNCRKPHLSTPQLVQVRPYTYQNKHGTIIHTKPFIRLSKYERQVKNRPKPDPNITFKFSPKLQAEWVLLPLEEAIQ